MAMYQPSLAYQDSQILDEIVTLYQISTKGLHTKIRCVEGGRGVYWRLRFFTKVRFNRPATDNHTLYIKFKRTGEKLTINIDIET